MGISDHLTPFLCSFEKTKSQKTGDFFRNYRNNLIEGRSVNTIARLKQSGLVIQRGRRYILARGTGESVWPGIEGRMGSY